MSEMIVAYYIPHNNGAEKGFLDAPGQDLLIDSVQVGAVRTFATRTEAEAWLIRQTEDEDEEGFDVPPHLTETVSVEMAEDARLMRVTDTEARE